MSGICHIHYHCVGAGIPYGVCGGAILLVAEQEIVALHFQFAVVAYLYVVQMPVYG